MQRGDAYPDGDEPVATVVSPASGRRTLPAALTGLARLVVLGVAAVFVLSGCGVPGSPPDETIPGETAEEYRWRTHADEELRLAGAAIRRARAELQEHGSKGSAPDKAARQAVEHLDEAVRGFERARKARTDAYQKAQVEAEKDAEAAGESVGWTAGLTALLTAVAALFTAIGGFLGTMISWRKWRNASTAPADTSVPADRSVPADMAASDDTAESGESAAVESD